MVDGWKRSWKKLPSLKGWRARCGFILQLAPTVRLAMPERQDLPVEREIIEPVEVMAQPEAFRCIGEEISETLDYRPAKFFRHQIVRRKFVARQAPQVPPMIAPLPA